MREQSVEERRARGELAVGVHPLESREGVALYVDRKSVV